MDTIEKTSKHIDGNISFLSKPDDIEPSVSISTYDFSERMKKIFEPLEKSIDSMTANIYPYMAKSLDEFYKSLAKTIEPSIQMINQSYREYDWSMLTKPIIDRLNEQFNLCDWFYLAQRLTPALESIKTSTQSISIDFSKDDLETIELLNIPLDEYATTSPNKPNSWFITLKKAISLIISLITIISFIDKKITDIKSSERNSEMQQQLEELNSTNHQIENLLNKIYNELEEN